MTRLKHASDAGFLLITLMIGTLFISVLTISIAHFVVVNYALSSAEFYRVSTQLAVDAAVSEALIELNEDSTWPGTGSAMTLLDKNNAKTTYTTSVIPISSTSKQLVITSKVFIPSSASIPISQRSVRVAVATSSVSAPSSEKYKMVAGYGGVSIGGSSSIEGGNIYINGKLTADNTAQIGSSSDPVKLYVAHQVCGASDGTYPRVCDSGENGQPISLYVTSKIYGEVRATNQTTTTNMFNPGLIAGEVAPVAQMPTHDRAAIMTTSSTSLSASAASCSGGDKTWPANVKISGSVIVDGTCTVTLSGNAWITGSLEVSNRGDLVVAEGLKTPPTIMIDGSNGFVGTDNGVLEPNSANVGFQVVTYYANAACNPGCTSLTSSEQASNVGRITLSVNEGFSAAGSELYARWGKLYVGGNGTMGALAGQSIEIESSGNIELDSTVNDFTSPSAQVTNWKIQSYKRVFS